MENVINMNNIVTAAKQAKWHNPYEERRKNIATESLICETAMTRACKQFQEIDAPLMNSLTKLTELKDKYVSNEAKIKANREKIAGLRKTQSETMRGRDTVKNRVLQASLYNEIANLEDQNERLRKEQSEIQIEYSETKVTYVKLVAQYNEINTVYRICKDYREYIKDMSKECDSKSVLTDFMSFADFTSANTVAIGA